MLTRRNVLASAFCIYALLREAKASPVSTRSLSVARWIARHDELANGLRTGSVSQSQWHSAVNAMAREIDLEALAYEMRRARTRLAGAPFGKDPQKRFISFLDDNGNVIRHSYGLALFDFDEQSVITPHAHKHMVSAHMVIDGKVRVRTFDRVRDDGDALIIRPASDEVAEPGHAAAMTGIRDNIHWFTPKSKRAMTLDIIIDGLDQGKERYLIQPIDPLGGKKMADGSIRAPLISFDDSMARYNAAL